MKARKSPNAIAARAIVKGGTGHKYWDRFPEQAKLESETLSKEINLALYQPPIGDLPVKTLDLPVAGRRYNALPFIFDLVNQSNEGKIADSTKKKEINESLPEDADGSQTVLFLKNVRRAIQRITGNNSSSLGLHPVVYFYTLGGQFQPSAFLAAVELLKKLEEEDKLKEFTSASTDLS